MFSKGDIALAALEELRISGLTVKANPEEIKKSIQKLDMLMASWRNKNLCLGYIPSLSYNNIDANQDSGLADNEIFAVINNLAKSESTKFGKETPQRILELSDESYKDLFSVILTTRENNPYLPMGSGETFSYYNSLYHGFYNQYFPTDTNAPDDCQTFDLKVGQTDFFSVDFNDYLLDGNTISSFTIADGEGVAVLSSAESEGIITLECQGSIDGYSPVKITVTSTPSGRVNPETINFNVTLI